jgi:hypothetical protein
VNPFQALIDIFKFKNEKDKEKPESADKIKKDSYIEEIMRKIAKESAKNFCFTVYDVYKKAHAMASSPENFDNGNLD